MDDFEDKFTALVCPNCQGQVELSKVNVDDFAVISGNTVMYIGDGRGHDAECTHCGTKFIRKQQYQGKPKTATNTTVFLGKVTGPIHTGSGNINIKG